LIRVEQTAADWSEQWKVNIKLLVLGRGRKALGRKNQGGPVAFWAGRVPKTAREKLVPIRRPTTHPPVPPGPECHLAYFTRGVGVFNGQEGSYLLAGWGATGAAKIEVWQKAATHNKKRGTAQPLMYTAGLHCPQFTGTGT
jgi:hypothetical protein